MTEAGLPIIVYQGAGGGIELGFDYRSHLTALTPDEAEALALMLAHPHPALDALGLAQAARRAVGKVSETQTAPIRAAMKTATARFALENVSVDTDDIRIPALARAIRRHNPVTLRARSGSPQQILPCHLHFDGSAWALMAYDDPSPIAQSNWGDLVISNKTQPPREQPG